MKKPALMAVLLMSMAVSGVVQAAQWRKVSSGPGNVFYIDSTKVVKKDKTRKVWSMQSYTKAQQTPEGKPYRSVKAQHLYSCEDRTAVMQSGRKSAGEGVQALTSAAPAEVSGCSGNPGTRCPSARSGRRRTPRR
jgi:hypothetical protein